MTRRGVGASDRPATGDDPQRRAADVLEVIGALGIRPAYARVRMPALLLTGRPGIGKTTVVRATARKLAGFHLVGFYTEEIRAGRERRGFRLVTFAGQEEVIAHVDLPPPRISKYGCMGKITTK